jgi:hypothetical protein
VTHAKKNYRVKVFRVYDVEHDHELTQPCGSTCVRGTAAYVGWVDGDAHWCEAKLDLIDDKDPRWYRR